MVADKRGNLWVLDPGAPNAEKVAGLMPPPPALQPDKRDRITRLIAVDPAGFDGAYLTQQVSAHEAALALQRAHAAGGDTPPLVAVARGAVPIVTGHLDEAQRMLAVPPR